MSRLADLIAVAVAGLLGLICLGIFLPLVGAANLLLATAIVGAFEVSRAWWRHRGHTPRLAR